MGARGHGFECYELHTGRGGATMPTRHPMMLFCRTFGALAPPERQGCHHQGGQRGLRGGAHGFRAPATARPRVGARPARSVRPMAHVESGDFMWSADIYGTKFSVSTIVSHKITYAY